MQILSPIKIILYTLIIYLSMPHNSTAATIAVNPVTTQISGFTEENIGSTYASYFVNPQLAKIYGTHQFTAAGSTDAEITIDVNGSISDLVNGEEIGLDYEFSFTQNSSVGSVFWSIATQLHIPVYGSFAGPSASNFDDEVTTGNSGSIEGSESYTNNSGSNIESATFTAVITVQWSGIESGDTLTFTVPNNSIDYKVDGVPEPSSILLLSFGSLLLLRRKRD